ncbi:hypothetical protein V1273_001690 [Bradyrhizobium sp. AZCC 1721]
MARLPLIDPATTSGDVRASFDRMPVVLNIFRMMAHAEDAAFNAAERRCWRSAAK